MISNIKEAFLRSAVNVSLTANGPAANDASTAIGRRLRALMLAIAAPSQSPVRAECRAVRTLPARRRRGPWPGLTRGWEPVFRKTCPNEVLWDLTPGIML